MSKETLDIFSANSDAAMEQFFVDGGVKAGFPVPSGDDISQSLDLNKVLVQHPAATFYARVVGNSMVDAGVEEGDLLVIDRSLAPQNGSMAVCFIDGEFTLKFINLDEKERGVIWLQPANDQYPPIKVTPDNDFVLHPKSWTLNFIYRMIIDIIQTVLDRIHFKFEFDALVVIIVNVFSQLNLELLH